MNSLALPARAAAAAGALATVAAIRLHETQPGLLYPDGYQYLLMAKGIATHGRPLLELGAGGDTLLPSADAAAKPLFPALVAAVHALGLDWTDAARLTTALAAAASVVLAGVLAGRLTGSRLAGLAAAGACLASPELRFWTGFAGPDPLAQALALGAALALLAARPALGGTLAALAVLTRPELAAPAAAAALVGLALPSARPAATRSLLAFALTAAAVLAAFRPPLAAPQPEVVAALGVIPAASLAFLLLLRGGSGRAIAAAIGLVSAAVVVGAGGAATGAHTWLATEWPLLLAAAVGFLAAARSPSLRTPANATLLAGALLALVYWTKNPASDRYLTLLTPLLAVLLALGVGALASRSRTVVVALVALAVVVPAVLGGRTPAGQDAFAAVTRQLESRALPTRPLVTAAPDAYGVLVSDRPVRVLRPGATGLVLLDGAQRAYQPGIRVRGRELARLDPGPGFQRPDGTVDLEPVIVVLGTVIAA